MGAGICKSLSFTNPDFIISAQNPTYRPFVSKSQKIRQGLLPWGVPETYTLDSYLNHPSSLKLSDQRRAFKYELTEEKALPPIYTWNTNEKKSNVETVATRIKNCFKHLLDFLIVKTAFLPASNGFRRPKNQLDDFRCQIQQDSDMVYKRFSVQVDGMLVDGVMFGKAGTLNNGKWGLISNGNDICYEELIDRREGDCSHIQMLKDLEFNGIVFNYPGVGRSTGISGKETAVKAYQAMMHFIEDKEYGIGAKEHIGIGYSQGGAIQSEALKGHELKPNIKYVFVKDRTFSSFSKVAYELVKQKYGAVLGKIVSKLIQTSNCNIGVIENSKNLNACEIILQTREEIKSTTRNKTRVLQDPVQLGNAELIIDDGIIPKDATLGKAIFEQKIDKCVLGIQEKHSDYLDESTIKGLKDLIIAMLGRQTTTETDLIEFGDQH